MVELFLVLVFALRLRCVRPAFLEDFCSGHQHRHHNHHRHRSPSDVRSQVIGVQLGLRVLVTGVLAATLVAVFGQTNQREETTRV